MIGKDADGLPVDTLPILYADNWLQVLAAPHVYQALTRPVDPALLLRLLDVWISYVDRGDSYLFADPPDAGRPALARKLRALLEAWTPPELPGEITEAARALLHAEGYKTPPRGAATWDDLEYCSPGRTIESYLIWPEGLEAIFPKVATEAEIEARNLERKTQVAAYLKQREQ